LRIKIDCILITSKVIKMSESIIFIENSRFVRITTIADGNCLVHSFLRASYKDYVDNENQNTRKVMAIRFRHMMADYIIQPEEEYETEESVVRMIKKEYNLDKPRNFISFLESMYDFKIDEKYNYPKDKDYVKELYNEAEKVVDCRIKLLQEELESKLGNNLYLPNKFNKGVLEAVLNNEPIPEGLYENIPYNARLFTYCKGGNIIKIAYEHNKLDDIVFLRDIPNFFRSNQFIGDGDVLSLIPDIIQINFIIIDTNKKELISIYETDKSDRYIFINNINNIHYEAVGVLDDENRIITIHSKTEEMIDQILKTRSINFI
jgi:hypothetical protein